MRQSHRTSHRRKSVLFCPECWHESPIDGDWITERTKGRLSRGCPECGVVVDVRPVPREDDPVTSDSDRDIDAVGRFVRHLVRFLTSGLRHWNVGWARG
jgi:hypothetical protein